ncbi:GntR family transcriptional regulator [Thalassospira sp. TSL5-1]|uniref:GntR family transcriptional regulator n=1 Tax=Thalassospira sp. TSL5-1 TaxID=1544451 RepID=UPI00093CDC30|nr:GntR family transcriptional regulator [Thalassospira sp. TSL5-1]OKH88014.1 GntR family transcriptional regulator [Thalassospira sp. TSL5-1]
MPSQNNIPTVQHICQIITQAIREGRLAPGQRLTEAEFTRKLAVSRPTIREAFRQLCNDGLLQFEPHRGASVRQLTRHELDDLFVIRASLEALAVRLSAPLLEQAPGPLLQIQASLDKAEQEGDRKKMAKYNIAFHQLFAETSGNTLLQSILNRLTNSVYWLQLQALIHDEQVMHTNSQHQQITAAILAGRGDDAALIMTDHIERSRQLTQWLDDSRFAQAD